MVIFYRITVYYLKILGKIWMQKQNEKKYPNFLMSNYEITIIVFFSSQILFGPVNVNFFIICDDDDDDDGVQLQL